MKINFLRSSTFSKKIQELFQFLTFKPKLFNTKLLILAEISLIISKWSKLVILTQEFTWLEAVTIRVFLKPCSNAKSLFKFLILQPTIYNSNQRKTWNLQDMVILCAPLVDDISSYLAQERKSTKQLIELSFMIYKLTNGLN